MADQAPATPTIELRGISQADYQARVASHIHNFTVVGPCSKCGGSAKVEWVSRSISSFGETLNGACRRCNGKGFMTNFDVARNNEYETWRVERAREDLARFQVTAAPDAVAV